MTTKDDKAKSEELHGKALELSLNLANLGRFLEMQGVNDPRVTQALADCVKIVKDLKDSSEAKEDAEPSSKGHKK